MKQGDWFSAKIDGTNCIGQVQLERGTYYLCQNSKYGDEPQCLLGWKNGWNIGKGTASDLIRNDVKDFKIITKEEAIKLGVKPPKFDITSIPKEIGKFFGYNVTKVGSKFKFGCGEVTLTEKEIKDFLEIRKENSIKLQNYTKIATILKEQDVENNANTVKQ